MCHDLLLSTEWVSLLEPGEDGANADLESSDVIRKFASVLQENEQLKQEKRDLKEEQEKCSLSSSCQLFLFALVLCLV